MKCKECGKLYKITNDKFEKPYFVRNCDCDTTMDKELIEDFYGDTEENIKKNIITILNEKLFNAQEQQMIAEKITFDADTAEFWKKEQNEIKACIHWVESQNDST